MKKIIFAIALVMTMSFAASAQHDSYFKWSDADNEVIRDFEGNGITIALPSHGNDFDSNAPLRSGLLLLTAFGAVYALRKTNEKL